MDELPAEELGAVGVEQDDGHVVVDRQAVGLERRRGRARRRPRTTPRSRAVRTRPARRARPGSAQPRRQRGSARTGRARSRDRRATCGGSRRGSRPGHRNDRRGASWADCRMAGCRHRRPPGTVMATRRGRCNGPARGVVLGIDGHRQHRSSLPWRTTWTERSRRSCASTRTGSTRSRCASSATRATRRRRPRTRSSAPTERWRGTTRHGSASCGCGRGWRRSCSTCAARVSAGAGPGGRRCRWTWSCPATSSHARTRAADRPRPPPLHDAADDWAGLLMTLPPAYRSAVVLRHVDGLSYPELAAALDRPEGTVKAQVHRGVALLRTAYEAAERRERERMTA